MLPYLATLLDDAQIDVLIYNGDRDLLANQPGSELALNKLQWSGQHGWSDVNKFNRSLYIDSPNSIGGYIKSYKNLHLLSVYNSGHMVPYNRPKLALDLITRFITGQSFHDVPLPNHKAKIYDRTSLKEHIDTNTIITKNGSIEYDDNDEMDIEDIKNIDSKSTVINTLTINMKQLLHNPVFVWITTPIIFIIGILVGILITRRQQQKYNGYDTIPPIPIGYTQRNERI
jgi:Serine carboxypeptidase